jgi:hypothetical protein
MKSHECQVSHPLIVNDTEEKTGRGKKPPSLGSGGSSPSAKAWHSSNVTALPFEQQPRESAKAFAAFKTYLELGPERSLSAVARKLSKSEQLLKRWSAKFDWTSRVKAHCAYVAEVERLAIERVAVEKAVEWQKTHEATKREAWKEAEQTIAMVRKAREEWMTKGRLPGWEGMARMLELAFKLKQFASGLPSEVKEVHNTFEAKLELDWEIALRKVYGPPSGEIVDVTPKETE